MARQLRHPGGLAGRLVGVMMNRNNRREITAAVDALSPATGTVVGDIGFGGGLGIELLLDRVGAAGRVHGIEVSTAMLNRAARRFRREVTDGRLALHAGSFTDLPLPGSSLDGAITVHTIYFVDDLGRAFSELGRTLKASSHAVIGIADPDWMRDLPFTTYGFRLRAIPAITDTIADAGLILDDHRCVGRGPHPYHLLVVTPADRVP
jgi:ubiquinone/menaquinone biosynthesis C-methylase UbiE